jgi:hypothetical protein
MSEPERADITGGDQAVPGARTLSVIVIVVVSLIDAVRTRRA